MSNRLDDYLTRALKGWTGQYRPPAGSRARLLLLASTSGAKSIHIPSFRRDDRTPSSRFHLEQTDHVSNQIFNNAWLLRFHLA